MRRRGAAAPGPRSAHSTPASADSLCPAGSAPVCESSCDRQSSQNVSSETNAEAFDHHDSTSLAPLTHADRAHYDYFFHKAGEANNRIATALLYLAEVEEGGETVFPNTAVPKGRTGKWSDCANTGVAVKPEKRAVLLFWSMKTGGELDGGSSHAGCPVIKGTKWTATKWMHVAPGNQWDAHQKARRLPTRSTYPTSTVLTVHPV